MTDTIVVEAFVPTSPNQAWDAFTTPTEITQWNLAAPDWHCPSATVELRVGGNLLQPRVQRDAGVVRR